METSASLFLKRDIQSATRKIQRTFFEIIDDIKASDQDNYSDLVDILKDDNLARKFVIFQENRTKVIRKKILDCTGDLQRELENSIQDCDVSYKEQVTIKGMMKNEDSV